MTTHLRAPDGARAGAGSAERVADEFRPAPPENIAFDRSPIEAGTVRQELEFLLGLLAMMIDELRSVVVHFTAARPGEGTTTITREVALAAAATGWCKVALIDARIQPAAAHHDGAALPGLVEAFEQGLEPQLRLTRTHHVAFDTAALSAGPQGATRVDSVRQLYATLRSRYSLILIDSPPVFSGRQAAVIAGLADCTVLVVEAERTPVSDLVRARETLEQLGAKLIGVALNKTRHRVPDLLGRFL